jgi:hypothetical protein
MDPFLDIGFDVVKDIVYLVFVLKSSLSYFKLYVKMFAANSGYTVTVTFDGLLITCDPVESLTTTFEKTMNYLVAGGLITFVMLKENVPID